MRTRSGARGRRKRRRVGALIGAGLVLVVLLAVVVGGSFLFQSSPRIGPGDADDPSGGRAIPNSRSDTEDLRVGDGSYLDGSSYLRGVNIYSLVFNGQGTDASALGEPQASYDYLAARGVTIVRLAVPWQRLQEIPADGSASDGLDQPISQSYLDVVVEQVRRAASAGIRTVVDLHNGCTYPWGAGTFVEGSVRCGDGISEDQVTAIWRAIASRFVGDERVVAFDVFNEPRWSVGVDVYKRFSQVAVDAIRSTGAQQSVWVEGILSDTRGRLAAIAPDGPWISDPLGKVVYSEHFYDDQGGEQYDPTADHGVVLQRLTDFAHWCTRWVVHCAVGEVGWPSGGASGVQPAASGAAWNALFDQFYALADQYGLDVTYFAASSVSRTGTLLAYVGSSPGDALVGIDTSLSQAQVIERHLTR